MYHLHRYKLKKIFLNLLTYKQNKFKHQIKMFFPFRNDKNKVVLNFSFTKHVCGSFLYPIPLKILYYSFVHFNLIYCILI